MKGIQGHIRTLQHNTPAPLRAGLLPFTRAHYRCFPELLGVLPQTCSPILGFCTCLFCLRCSSIILTISELKNFLLHPCHQFLSKCLPVWQVGRVQHCFLLFRTILYTTSWLVLALLPDCEFSAIGFLADLCLYLLGLVPGTKMFTMVVHKVIPIKKRLDYIPYGGGKSSFPVVSMWNSLFLCYYCIIYFYNCKPTLAHPVYYVYFFLFFSKKFLSIYF